MGIQIEKINLKTYKQTKRYRVLDSTCNPSPRTEEMIGCIFERRNKNDNKNIICLYNKDKSVTRYFYKSDLQEVTGVIKDGYEIGIGDTVKLDDKEWIVYDYLYFDGEWDVSVCDKDKEPFEDCYYLNSEDIEKVIPLKTFKKEGMSEDDMIAHLKKVGRIKQGDIIK